MVDLRNDFLDNRNIQAGHFHDGTPCIVVDNCEDFELVEKLILLSRNEKFNNNEFISYFKYYDSKYADDNIYYDDMVSTCDCCYSYVLNDNDGVKNYYVNETSCELICKDCVNDNEENIKDYINYLVNGVNSNNKHRTCNTLIDDNKILENMGYKKIDYLFENGMSYNNVNINKLDNEVKRLGGFYSLSGCNMFNTSYYVFIPENSNIDEDIFIKELVM